MKIGHKEVQERQEVLEWFHRAQLAKLLENAAKGTWKNESIEDLIKRMEEEVIELKEAVQSGAYTEIVRECADVANFAMFIADRVRT